MRGALRILAGSMYELFAETVVSPGLGDRAFARDASTAFFLAATCPSPPKAVGSPRAARPAAPSEETP